MPEQLAKFQKAFGQYLRDADEAVPFPGVSERRAGVYKELLFNNISGFLTKCFPVCKSIVGDDDWVLLCQKFFQKWRCHTPYFKEIPGEYLEFLTSVSEQMELPPWFVELAHYEWVELEVETLETSGVDFLVNGATQPSFAQKGLHCNPTLQNLSYEWPVHKISKASLPELPEKVFLLVYRTEEFDVKFTEINAATSLLIALIQEGCAAREVLFDRLAELLNSPNVAGFGSQIVSDLLAQEILFEL